ncbi:MAG: HIT domain-containing protein [Planctomycetota bacterium]
MGDDRTTDGGGGAGPEAIWAPWRLRYLETLGEDAPPDDGGAKRAGPKPGAASAAGFLREYWAHPERDGSNHVLFRDDAGMILLNKYPYANGHLLVALGEARPRLLDYEPGARSRLWALVDRAMGLMERAINPQGVNVGINQGRAAGAGVPGHLHAHLVPRWGGDTNFMASVGGVRVIPSSLEAMAGRYRAVLGPG